MFHTFKGPGNPRQKHDMTGAFAKSHDYHFMTPLVIFPERNLYEIAKFTRTRGWDDDIGRNAQLVDLVFLEDVVVVFFFAP